MVGLNRTALTVSVALAFLLLAPVAGAVHEDGETHAEVSSKDLVCEDAEVCRAPTAEARASVKHPSVDATLPNPECVTDETLGATPDLSDCEVDRPDVDPAIVRAYAGVDGLEATAGDDDSQAETQSQEASASSGSGLNLDMEAAALIGALGIGASGAAALVGLRRIAAFLLAPLASRLQRSDLLENETRRKIYELIDEEPGINLRGLADEVDVAWGTLLHHLKKLEDNHLVKSERYGKYRRFFKNGSTYTEAEQERLAALSKPSTARVAEYILQNPGANQSEIGDQIGVTASTILFHVKRLKEVGLVEEKREGRYVHYYPSMNGEEAKRLNPA